MDYRRYLERAIAIFPSTMLYWAIYLRPTRNRYLNASAPSISPTVWMTAMRKRATSISMRPLSFLRNPELKMAFSFIPIFHIHPQN